MKTVRIIAVPHYQDIWHQIWMKPDENCKDNWLFPITRTFGIRMKTVGVVFGLFQPLMVDLLRKSTQWHKSLIIGRLPKIVKPVFPITWIFIMKPGSNWTNTVRVVF